ncbi:methyltransferase domain-containing protein [Siccirubricoccus phaeus]|uniref:methyltransferase domain-containing protein n=1 Tax=Siccirubricoccus phaeus TaxID=2595053 RepID=UPI0011F14AA1|nr:methyltransferase domain-containing protein [Siccirubricoccus phaeus]
MDLKEEEILGDGIDAHWYYRAKLAALRRWTADLRPAALLDVGAGSGHFSRKLLELTPAVTGTCVDPGYPADREEQVAGKPLLFRREVAATGADLVLLMDVLEHVDDDTGLLAAYVGKARSGACFVLTVPAFQWLWSGHDVFLEHRRRYTLPQLEGVARAAGLQVERAAYYFGAVLPLAAGLRLVGRLRGEDPRQARSQMQRHGALVNGVLGALCAVELPLFPHNRLAGLSIFLRARKP